MVLTTHPTHINLFPEVRMLRFQSQNKLILEMGERLYERQGKVTLARKMEAKMMLKLGSRHTMSCLEAAFKPGGGACPPSSIADTEAGGTL